MQYQDKIVVITGAAHGIGKAIAKAYAQEGAKVVIADRDEKTGKKALQEIMEPGREALFIRTDVSRADDITALMRQVKHEYGTVDILINNAGKAVFKPVYDLSVDEWDDVIDSNLRSVFLCSREAAKMMRNNEKGGRIINIASTRAFMSEAGTEAYSASKGGIIALTHALAVSLSDDHIMVNAISPGWIATEDYDKLGKADHEQHLSKRVGKPDDIARACLYLTAEANDFVTGANLMIDGGMTRKMIYAE